jgi:hypothetical protein
MDVFYYLLNSFVARGCVDRWLSGRSLLAIEQRALDNWIEN